MRAIVVDDSRSMRMILRKQLSSAGFEVVEAEQGRDALDKLRAMSQSIDVALVDWNMPVMTGLELVEAIRADGTLSRVRILMVTSESELIFVEKALQAGANEYLMKPFTMEGLLGKLELLGIAP
jgi:two-component system chemotaxis response regulator CheY